MSKFYGILLLLCTAHALFVTVSAVPDHWTSFYHRTFASRQQQAAKQCDASAMTPASIVCQSARLITPSGNTNHIHVCPLDGDPTKVCFNSKLRRCCPNEGATCVSRTTLRVANQDVEVKIYENTTGHICIDFNINDITRCCPISDTGLPERCRIPPGPPPCVPKRDIYFVVDSTDSIGDDIFCRFGYVLQLITAAVNPQGINGARMAAVLFEFQPHTTARYLFGLDDQCASTVSSKIPRVVYEYYKVGKGEISSSSGELQYPNVRATSTQPYSALDKVADSTESISNRPSSVIIMTDGKSHQVVTSVINRLKKTSDPLIGAGIGAGTDTAFLLTISSNQSTVVYEPDRNKPIDFGKRIIEVMRDTAALCPEEAQRILNALDATQDRDMKDYCESCLWTSEANRDTAKCNTLMPTCGAQSLMMQSFDDNSKSFNNKVFSAEWEKLLLEGEIAKAVEGVIARIKG